MTPAAISELETACQRLEGSALRQLPPLAADSVLVACFADTQASAMCREFTAAFARYAIEHPTATFVWIDVTTDADLVGELDRSDLPAWAVYRGSTLMHFSASPPVLDELPEAIGYAQRSLIPQPSADLATLQVRTLIQGLVDRWQVYVVAPPSSPPTKTVTKDF